MASADSACIGRLKAQPIECIYQSTCLFEGICLHNVLQLQTGKNFTRRTNGLAWVRLPMIFAPGIQMPSFIFVDLMVGP